MNRVFALSALTAVSVMMPVAVTVAQGLSETDLRRYGQQLSQECLTCHRLDGKDVGVPPIVDLSREEFIKALHLYRTGLRENPTMVSVASTLDDEQVEALALYFSTLNRR